MLDNRFFLLLVNFLWMVGLFGTLFTLAYTVQYRRQRWWNVGHSSNVPRTLVPLYLALATLCAGLTLHAYVAQQAVSVGVAAIWGGLALLFLVRFFSVLGLGIQAGWDAPLLASLEIAPWRRALGWPLLALALLLTNVALLGWWGNQQLNAEPAQPATGQAVAQGNGLASLFTNPFVAAPTPTPLPPTVMTPRLSIKAAAPLTATVSSQLATALPPAADSAPTAAQPTGAAAVVTLAPELLQITPTPLGGIALTFTTPTPAGIVALPAVTTATPFPAPPPALTGTLTVTIPTSVLTPTVIAREATALAVAGVVQSPAGANVRAAPTTTAAVLILLPDRSPLTLVGRTDDSSWFALTLADDRQGWIAAQLVSADVAALATLPVLPSP